MPTPAKQFDHATMPNVWKVPPEMLRIRLRREVLLMLILFWQWVGCKPGRLAVSTSECKRATGISDRSFRRCLDSLEAAGLIRIAHRDGRGAEFDVLDWRLPRAARRTENRGARSAQLSLPFADEDDGGPVSLPFTQLKARAWRLGVGGEPPKAG